MTASEGIKILLIEDDKVDGMFFQRALKSTGLNAELVIAMNAETGIDKFRTVPFDCVFLDYMLPGTDGVAVLKQLREDESSSIVLITSHGDEKIAVEAMKAGALDYIAKDLITPESLEKIIRNVIRFRDTQKEKRAIEEAFRQGEKRYRIFFEKSQGFFCTHDVEGHFISVNDAGAQSINYTPEELVGSSLKKVLSPDTQHFFETYLKQILTKKTASGLMKVLTKNGEERIWSYNNTLYEEQADTYIIASIQDITDRIKMEEEKLNSKRVAEESAEIKRMSNEISLYANKLKDSIKYAKRLQKGLYKSVDGFKAVFPNSFVINHPKEIVSGDFYWYKTTPTKTMLALADCTGHGVPGALLSTMGYTMLTNITANLHFNSPDQLLKKLSDDWGKTFDFFSRQANNYDGMEVAICFIDYENKTIEFSAMGGYLFLVRDGELMEYRGENIGISSNHVTGFDKQDTALPACTKITLQKNDCIYLFTDGYRDQFGGPNKNEKFTKRKFKELIKEAAKHPIDKQAHLVEDTFINWKGDGVQMDDVLVIGILF